MKLDALYALIIMDAPTIPEGKRRFINTLRAIWADELDPD